MDDKDMFEELVTADNNPIQEELDENCKKIDLLINDLEDYSNLKNLRDKLIYYRNNITLYLMRVLWDLKKTLKIEG